jgi:hypothetical protein
MELLKHHKKTNTTNNRQKKKKKSNKVVQWSTLVVHCSVVIGSPQLPLLSRKIIHCFHQIHCIHTHTTAKMSKISRRSQETYYPYWMILQKISIIIVPCSNTTIQHANNIAFLNSEALDSIDNLSSNQRKLFQKHHYYLRLPIEKHLQKIKIMTSSSIIYTLPHI